MKSSIFKKVALWLLIIITAVEVVMFAALYTYTYNKAVAEATAGTDHNICAYQRLQSV